VRELDDDERPALFRTMVTHVKKIAPPPPPPPFGRKPIAPSSLAAHLAGEPGRFGIYPVRKSGSNPWSDRVLVGRAVNNDIVLRNDRISKLHAYFELHGRETTRVAWRLYDARSANGTRVDGVTVPPGEEGIEVRGGQVVQFGTVSTQILDSGALYDAI
jgi:pSer/pThr/pTyr-binding forkhead associated (FHA) protein